MKEKYEEFKKGVYYQMLLPTNDFAKRKPYTISSNVPAADNSIAIYKISEDHLIFIVRQDKIGYDTDDLIKMITDGIIKIVDAINSWEQFKKYKIELIYTLAWSRK